MEVGLGGFYAKLCLKLCWSFQSYRYQSKDMAHLPQNGRLALQGEISSRISNLRISLISHRDKTFWQTADSARVVVQASRHADR